MNSSFAQQTMDSVQFIPGIGEVQLFDGCTVTAQLDARSSCDQDNGCDDGANHTGRLVQLIAQHRPALLKYVRRILACEEDAEDVVQETCVRLMRVHDLWRGEREVRAFLFKIATNLARDELRRRKTRCHSMHLSYETVDLIGEEQRPEEVVDQHMALEMISQTLLCLPPRYREVFNLHVEGHLSYRAIARRLGISTKTVERDMRGVQDLCLDRFGMAAPATAELAL